METTLNVDCAVMKIITASARGRGMSRSGLIIMLIKRIMNDLPDPGRLGRMVRYQKKRRPEEWHLFHLQLRADDYEFFLDLRKLLKMSISLILAIAVKKYLREILNNSTDNYQYKNYVIIQKLIGRTMSWHLIWGYPPKIQSLLQ